MGVRNHLTEEGSIWCFHMFPHVATSPKAGHMQINTEICVSCRGIPNKKTLWKTSQLNNQGYLVGGAITILKNMSSSMGRMTSHIWNGKSKIFQTTKQIITHAHGHFKTHSSSEFGSCSITFHHFPQANPSFMISRMQLTNLHNPDQISISARNPHHQRENFRMKSATVSSKSPKVSVSSSPPKPNRFENSCSWKT